jgi:hypothetical protein
MDHDEIRHQGVLIRRRMERIEQAMQQAENGTDEDKRIAKGFIRLEAKMLLQAAIRIYRDVFHLFKKRDTKEKGKEQS